MITVHDCVKIIRLLSVQFIPLLPLRSKLTCYELVMERAMSRELVLSSGQ